MRNEVGLSSDSVELLEAKEMIEQLMQASAEHHQQELRAARKAADRACKHLQRTVRLQTSSIQQLQSKNNKLEESAALETAKQSAVVSELKVRLEERDEKLHSCRFGCRHCMQSLRPLDNTGQDMRNIAPSRQAVVVKEYSVLELRQRAVQERRVPREWCRCMVKKQPERQRAGR